MRKAPYAEPWRAAGVLSILGPDTNQRWVLNSHILQHIDIKGYGMETGDVLRFIDLHDDCRGTARAARLCDAPDTPICKLPDADVRASLGARDYRLTVLGTDTVGCDKLNENCMSARVHSVKVMNRTHTRLRWTSDVPLEVGDFIRLGDGVACGRQDRCTPEKLAELLGE
jgi:hypothetical protein